MKKLVILILTFCYIILTFSLCVYAYQEKMPEPALAVSTTTASDTNNTADVKTPALKGGSEKKNREVVYTRVGDAAKAYPGLVFLNGKSDKKQVALTFDDGPDNNYTPRILDILKEANVKATFFVVGERVQANPTVMERIVAEGHFVGNHTWDHKNLSNLDINEFESGIHKTENEIIKFTGYQTAMFRPPYGVISNDVVSVLSDLNYKIIDWSADSMDWKGSKKEQVEVNILSNTKAGAIILQHSGGDRGDKLTGTVQALPQVIKKLKEQGYTLVTVPKLLELPGKK